MTEPAPLDPTRFLTTLPRWDQAAFFDALTLTPGALAAELPPRGEAELMGMLVVRQVDAAGNGAAQAAVRAVEDELERWHHGKPAIERRWVVAG